jgi:enamine deaminase RidA (YjgF/YER057c/UK114 family)
LNALAAALQVDYVPFSAMRHHPAAWWQNVLAVVRFDGAATSPPAAAPPATPPCAEPGLIDMPLTAVNAPVLAGGTAEVWRLAGPMRSGRRGRVHYRHNGRLLFASLSLAEHEFADPADPAGPADRASPADAAAAGAATALQRATVAGYREMFGALEALAFPYPLRIWNFLSEINGASGDGERYWHFNGARQDAFIGSNRSIAGNVPAASAVGVAAASPLTIYCIASTRAPLAFENPRQCSAWAYPAHYGPRSPTFARACIEDDAAQTLFISGTASIVGHASAHAGDQCAQTREIVRNIRALIQAANDRVGAARYTLERLRYKVYVRRAEHQPSIDRELRRAVGAAARVLYLKADICRPDLLVEIEAVGAPEPP